MSKTLVAYFSASGVTRNVAERLADAVQGDLFEIEPDPRYTSADLDWNNPHSRSSLEMNDRSSRPAMKKKVAHLEQYDRIFVGFPVWWYREPSIIDTFMESGDFSEKVIIPFATSGSSPIGEAGENMQKLAPAATVREGKRFPGGVSKAELKQWADQF